MSENINNQYDFFKKINIDENGNIGVFFTEETSPQPFEYTANNYTALTSATGMTEGNLAYVYNAEGTAWLPGTIGGTYYPSGVYVYNGSEWLSSRDGIAYQFYLDDARLDALEVGRNKFQFVYTKSDLPTPSAGIITLEANKTYFIASTIDLTGDRLVGSANTTIIGGSSENCILTSTGLGVGVPLLSSIYTTPIRYIAINDVDTAISFNGTTNPGEMALDWTGVNFLNVPNIGVITKASNFIFDKGAFLNSKGLAFDGTIGTVALNNSLFSGDGLAGNILEVKSTCTITRRFRVIYSSVVATSSTVGINVNGSATIPVESYILDTVNFTGGGTYLSGVVSTNNKALFVNCKGINNSAEVSQYYMNGNTTATTILATSTPVKVLGTTTSSSVTQKFTNTDNRATYIGSLMRYFSVTATLSVESGNNNQVGVYIAKNGTVIAESEVYGTTSGSGRAENIVVQTLVQLSENDYLEIFVENATATNDITVTDLNVIII